ncbi:hypothetical protein PLEOSDRAFT_1066099 [Pleurotus ostreatus PC15]|uniref:RING-type E3 ubiquitin transferase n=1 Tax=Pleurotus ostreatus (strain PC15) TaxID=1137138 RepID=A0A067NT97_PLEO1|nr:hypothetical protein PLEOSDRAFT_1066099 [Pleurotus ostreatus PC15]
MPSSHGLSISTNTAPVESISPHQTVAHAAKVPCTTYIVPYPQSRPRCRKLRKLVRALRVHCQTTNTSHADTCRICSGPAEPGQPLFHPCKCSGTIRYIHQDCLTTWLAHSKKKSCDVCKHPYSFTKVYSTDMPSKLPVTLVIRRLLQQTIWGILFVIRAIVVGTIWLAILPLMTIWTWRMYFSMGDYTAWWISDRHRPPSDRFIPNSLYQTVPAPVNITFPPLTLQFSGHPMWLTLSSDIFTGQIIASIIVLTFVAVFLLREWISQNARPGVFEDEELPDGDQVPAPPRRVEARVNELPEQLAQRQVEAIQALEALRAAEIQNGIDRDGRRILPHWQRIKRPLTGGDGEDPAGERGLVAESEIERLRRKAFNRRLQAARVYGARRKAQVGGTLPLVERELDRRDLVRDPIPPFEFTFRAPGDEELRRPASAPETMQSTAALNHEAIEALFRPPSAQDTPPSQETPPSSAAPPLPFSLSSLDSDDPTSSGGEEDELRIPTPPPPREHVFGGVLVIGADDTDEDGEEDEQSEDDDEEEHDLNEPVRLPQEGAHLFEIGQAPAEIAQLVENGVPADDQIEAGDQANEPGIPDAAAAALIAGNEDLDGNGEDDMEGALEAIGMRGPIYGVVQNAVVMIFVLHLTIGLGVWVPFTVGKSAALLVLDPYRCLQILHLPIKAMRVVTDPVVDSTIFLVTHAILPTILRIARRQVQTCCAFIVFLVRHLLGATIADKITHASDRIPSLMDFVEQPFSHLSPSMKATSPVQPSPGPTSILCKAVIPLVDSLGPVEPYFAAVGREVRVNFIQVKASWERLALGSGPAERAFAVALGYSIVAFILAIYLHILTVGSVKSAHRAVRSTVRQQLLVLKVAAFIIIELVAFPLGCGIVLDLCTVWLFPTTSLVARATYFFQAPLTAMFYHWVAGTVFMYSFAILLSSCRNIMRPGAMWFIKDPQDQNSHPIRDILDRPALTQLRKISVSGLMYSFVVVCVVSSVAGLLVLGRRSIMPFRLKTREPLSSVPIDLIFLHLVLPYTMHYFRPRKTLKALTTSLWRALAKRLRLSSYFFGGRYLAEEYTNKNFLAYFVEPADLLNKEAQWAGGLRRVPATDHIALPRDMRATAAVNEAGEPIDDFNKELIATQNAEAARANRSVKDDYTVVYLPPGFRYRLFAFIAILWTLGSLCLGVGVAFPIALGRGFFHLFVPYELHDGYSLIVGFYLLWGCYLFGRAIDKLDKRRQRRGDEGPRADLRVLILKRGLLWVLKITYIIIFLGFVIPTLVSIVMDLYLILPVRLLVNPSLSPTIRIVDAWALGLLYTKIALFTQRIGPDAPINQGLRRIMNHGWTNPDPVTATKEVIGPTMLGLSGMIALPAMLFLIANTYAPSLQLGAKATFIYVYPVIFALVAVSGAVSLMYKSLLAWSQAVRDKEFLVEMRLQNHIPETPRPSSSATPSIPSTA